MSTTISFKIETEEKLIETITVEKSDIDKIIAKLKFLFAVNYTTFSYTTSSDDVIFSFEKWGYDTVNLEEENVSRSLGVNNFGDTVVSNNWMFFGFAANTEREGDLREDSTHMNFQLKLNKPLAEALLDDEFTGTVEVTEFNSNVYGWVTVNNLEKVLNLYPELNKIKLVYRKKS